uniref:Catalase n=2 Tax=Meloidogyne TaxID=189290 RepID=A0A914LKK8_MELIC
MRLAPKLKIDTMTTSHGSLIETRTAVLTAGKRGPMLLQDSVFLDELMKFDRERIPERVVHAKGAAAFGYFDVTHDITKYTKASIFAKIGKRTSCFFRFSTVAGEKGSSDLLRDPRGFAMKYFTDEGNWDLVGNNAPIFFIRDPILFPSFIHSQKRNPRTNLHDPNMVWDFVSLRPEAINMILRIFSDLGTPDGFRKMNGFGTNTFKLVNANGTAVYCKFKLESVQGVHNLTAEKAAKLAQEDPDYSTRDLFNAIERGDFPKWIFKIQVMTFEQAAKYRYNPFDATKTWSEAEFPLITVGQVTLNKNPTNFFAQVEQAAFDPARMVRGIEASPDKLLQGRLFSYMDTHHHRLGPNHMLLPINRPLKPAENTQRDGLNQFGENGGDSPNYYPNSFKGPEPTGKAAQESQFVLEKEIVARFESGDDDNYSQPADMWKNQLDPGARKRLSENIAASLCQALPRIQKKMLNEFGKVSKDLQRMVEQEIKKRQNY